MWNSTFWADAVNADCEYDLIVLISNVKIQSSPCCNESIVWTSRIDKGLVRSFSSSDRTICCIDNLYVRTRCWFLPVSPVCCVKVGWCAGATVFLELKCCSWPHRCQQSSKPSATRDVTAFTLVYALWALSWVPSGQYMQRWVVPFWTSGDFHCQLLLCTSDCQASLWQKWSCHQKSISCNVWMGPYQSARYNMAEIRLAIRPCTIHPLTLSYVCRSSRTRSFWCQMR